MFKFLTQGAKIMRIRSGIIALATLAVLVGVITTLALSSFTAEAQGTRGAVANLQLTSTTAGTLTVSWDAASPVPTDYRIDWAKSGEDYKSWKVDEGHVYPTPATRPPPSRTSATTPSTRSACVLATTEANTKASHGADHGPLPPSQYRRTGGTDPTTA